MPLKIFNSLSGKKELFTPIEKGKTGIYICGPTVYNHIHIGNMRSFTAFDIIVRWLRYSGYDVTYVQNITDIDDKMIKRADEENTAVKKIAERYEKAYFEDMKAYNNTLPDVSPRATEHIAEIISLIEKIEKNGFAYEKDGDVYFSVSNFKDYGKLSGVSLKGLRPGARVEADEYKENPADFALWKAAKPGEPSWDSPWGKGRPGWHIECSAMSMKYLGETFDIHGGGKDLKFPHHENEIAQSESAAKKRFVNYWLHTEFLNIRGEKMAKSAGNFFTARELLKAFDAKDLRYFLISSHYRKPIDFSEAAIEDAKNSRVRLSNALKNAEYALRGKLDEREDETLEAETEKFCKSFAKAMDDDFNVPGALKYIFAFSSVLNRYSETPKSRPSLERAAASFMTACIDVLGLEPERLEEAPEEVIRLAEEREKARKGSDWKAADLLREEIKKKGYKVEDREGGFFLTPL